MLTEMLEMLAQMLEQTVTQMLGPLRCWLTCFAPMLGLLRCWLWRLGADEQQMLPDVAGLADVAGSNGAAPEIEGIEARIEAIEAK